MDNLKKIEKINLELKNYAKKIKSKNLLNQSTNPLLNLLTRGDRLSIEGNKEELNSNLMSNNQDKPVNKTKNLFSVLAGESNLAKHPKIQAFYQQKEELKQQKKLDLIKKNSQLNVQKVEVKSSVTSRLLNNMLKSNSKINQNLDLNRKGTSPYHHMDGGRGSINSLKKPISLISKNIHRHIRSQIKFNSEIALNSTLVYNFNNNNKKFILNSLLVNSFLNMGNIISKPVLFITHNKITINLFYYVLESEKNFNLINESENLEYLCSFLSTKFNKAVEIDLIRLHHPSLESQILANTIGLMSNNKKVRFRSIVSSLFNNTQIIKLNDSNKESNLRYCKPSSLVGIKIRLGGRILSQKVIPRFSTFSKQKGAFARTKSDFSTQSRFTDKSRRGSFSYTVSIAHKSF